MVVYWDSLLSTWQWGQTYHHHSCFTRNHHLFAHFIWPILILYDNITYSFTTKMERNVLMFQRRGGEGVGDATEAVGRL